MHFPDLRISRRPGLPAVLAILASTLSYGQATKPVISLDPPEERSAESQAARDATNQVPGKGESSFAGAPANFRAFASASAGEISNVERLTLRFAAETKLTKITADKDFRVEQGSSCVEGNVYAAKGTCTLVVRFTPQGAGRRFGRITIAHSGSATPFYVGLGGNGYAPVVSFTPAVIATVPGSFPSGKGLLNGAGNLSVDGGDTLYVADTGNNVIRVMDSSGVFNTIASGTLSAPYGIAADSFGDVYFSEPAAGLMYEIFNYGSLLQISGTGTDTCTVAAPCSLPNEQVYQPGQLSMDPYNQMFFVERSLGAATGAVMPYSPKLARIYDPFNYQAMTPGVMTVDAYDNLYSAWITKGVCSIVSQTFSDSSNSRGVYKKVAGGRVCGFSGDGGQARNAEISTTMGQFAFDVAGNMYLTDSGNQRVRRIDGATGIINTIAGNGTAGYTGDGGPATLATLSSPTGLAVDSQGQVYVISTAGASGTAQVIRKIGPNGALSFGTQAKGVASAAKLVTVANTGNLTLTLTKASIVGANAADFSIDPNTTSCNLVPGGSLANGQSCKVGIIFTPSATGTRTASLVLLDNSVTNTDTVLLSGTTAGSTLATPTFAITAPATGTTVTAGSNVTASVSVTSATAPAPTGTVKFTLSGAAYGSPVTVSGGTASITFTGLAAGTRTFTATYSGDANYAASGPLSRSITVTAAAVKAAAKVTLSAVANPASSCSAIEFKVGVAASTTGKPSGQVSLQEGNTVLAKATLNNGSATLMASGLAEGTHVLTASYGGDAVHAPSNSATFKEVVGSCSTRGTPIVVNRHPQVP